MISKVSFYLEHSKERLIISKIKKSDNNMDTIGQIQSKLQTVFQKYKVQRTILLRSYAKGSAHEMSDINIMVGSGLRGMAF